MQVNCSRLDVLSQLNATVAHFVITGMSAEERIYLEAILEACVEDVSTQMVGNYIENGNYSNKLEEVVQPLFKDTVQNITRQEFNLIVST